MTEMSTVVLVRENQKLRQRLEEEQKEAAKLREVLQKARHYVAMDLSTDPDASDVLDEIVALCSSGETKLSEGESPTSGDAPASEPVTPAGKERAGVTDKTAAITPNNNVETELHRIAACARDARKKRDHRYADGLFTAYTRISKAIKIFDSDVCFTCGRPINEHSANSYGLACPATADRPETDAASEALEALMRVRDWAWRGLGGIDANHQELAYLDADKETIRQALSQPAPAVPDEQRWLQAQHDNALGLIRMRGVPETRARYLVQALDVLLTRLDRQIESQQIAIQQLEHPADGDSPAVRMTCPICENGKLVYQEHSMCMDCHEQPVLSHQVLRNEKRMRDAATPTPDEDGE